MADDAEELEAAEVQRLLDEAERERDEQRRALDEVIADACRAEQIAQVEYAGRDAALNAEAARHEAEAIAVERRRDAAVRANADRAEAEADAADREEQRALDAAFYAERRAAREQPRVEADRARHEARRERRAAQRRAAEALARTEAAEAAASALAEAAQALAHASEVVGWVRILDADPCARWVAWWNSGGVPRGPAPVRPYTVRMKRHRGCQCVQQPVTRVEADVRGTQSRPERAPEARPTPPPSAPPADPTQPPTTDPATPPDPAAEVMPDATPDALRAEVHRLRDEAAAGRAATRRTDTLAQRLVEAYAAAMGLLSDPTDLRADLATVLDDDGLVDRTKVEQAVVMLLDAKPHLASRTPRGSIDQGSRDDAPGVDLAGLLRSGA